MQSEVWKEPILKLSADELKQAQSFIAELLQKLETQRLLQEEPIRIYPPEKEVNREELRADKRFDINVEGLCSVVKKDDFDPAQEMPINIKDISKHGICFMISQPLLPSNILAVKFSLTPIKASPGQFYKNLQKKIYTEVMRVLEVPSPTGVKYEIGARSIEIERVEESLKENERRMHINKLLAAKGDIKVLVVSLKEAMSKRLEEVLLKQGYVVYRTNQKQQAIALLRKNKCNIVISDAETAKIGDYELIKDIRGEFPDVGLLIEVDTIEEWKTISALKVDDYLTKSFSDRDLEIVMEFLYKKLICKDLPGAQSAPRWNKNQNLLVINTNESLRKLFCKVSEEMRTKLYFVNDIKHANVVLKRYKISFLFMESGIAGEEGRQFLTNVKKEFPGIGVAVISKNLAERTDFLASGADSFIVEPVGIQELLAT